MAALHRAVALEEVDEVAVRVAEDLHLDVLGAADVALEEHRVVAEGGAGLALRLFERAVELVGLLDDAHAAAAAAERRLDDHREADLARRSARLLRGSVTGSSVPGTTRDAGLLREARGRRSCRRAGRAARRSGPTKVMPARSQARGKRGVLGEEAVAGMDRVDALFRGERDDAFDVEIGFDRPFALADQIGFVGLEAVQTSRSSCE